MPRFPTLTYDRGTLILHPPPRGKDWMDHALWDDRIERFRIPALQYGQVLRALQGSDWVDQAKAWQALDLVDATGRSPYPHQREALAAWQANQQRGVVVLPTAAGKTYLAQLAIAATGLSSLIVVPTLDLMHQWYAQLLAAFPGVEIGLLGGGSRDRTPILVATYDSAAIQAEALGNRYGLLVFDECHHLPSDFNRKVADFSIAPYRLGLSATPERSDGKHADLDQLIGPQVYRRRAEELAGSALAQHQTIQLRVSLSPEERDRYETLIQTRNAFLERSKIFLGSLQGWQRFVQASAKSPEGRRAMLAHREARAIAFGTEAKLRLLQELLMRHYPERTLIFTDDNATVYRISQALLIPAITHQSAVKERHQVLARFKSGEYPILVASRVLNEGVDVPEASVAIVLSGTGSTREYVQRLGRVLRRGSDPEKVAVLYEVIAEETNEEGVARRRQPARSPETSPSPPPADSPSTPTQARGKRKSPAKQPADLIAYAKQRGAKIPAPIQPSLLQFGPLQANPPQSNSGFRAAESPASWPNPASSSPGSTTLAPTANLNPATGDTEAKDASPPEPPTSGSQISDFQTSDLQTSDLQTSGSQASGSEASGSQASGSQASGSQAPIAQTSSAQTSTSQTSGSQASEPPIWDDGEAW